VSRFAPWLKLAVILVMGLLILNLAYGFSGFGKRLGDFEFRSAALQAKPIEEDAWGNRFRGTWLGTIPVPVPSDFVRGVDLQRRDFETYPISYLRGQWSHEGWWYYYLCALTIKESLAILALALTALLLTAVVPGARVKLLDESMLLMPGVIVFALVSSQTRMNHHFRYVMPALPVLFIFASKVIAAKVPFQAWFRAWATMLVAWALISTYSFYPYTIGYFNELAGGAANGWRYLDDSNTDWSQGIFALKKWCDRNPDRNRRYVAPCRFGLDPKWFGVEYTPMLPDNHLPTVMNPSPEYGPVAGWHVISQNEIMRDDYEYLLEFQPGECIAGCYLVYYLSVEDVNRIRKQCGLPLILPDSERRKSDRR
jgi:hypothetical protein